MRIRRELCRAFSLILSLSLSWLDASLSVFPEFSYLCVCVLVFLRRRLVKTSISTARVNVFIAGRVRKKREMLKA